MSTNKNDLERLEKEVLQQKPQPSKRTRGPEARRKRMEENERVAGVGKKMISIRIDVDLLENFKGLSEGKGYQSMINQALREWWIARDIKGLVAQELEEFSTRLRSELTEEFAAKLKKAS